MVCRLRRLAIEARGLVLHGFGVFAHLLEAERSHQPQRLMMDESLDVLTADQRQESSNFDR
jgi:hypothetical protein